LYLAITAGIVEEIFFRGLPFLYVIERFPAKIPTGTYVVTTALLFGAIHWENGGHEVVATFIYGVFAAAFYLKLRDLWPLIGAHALIDVWGFW
jgi:membrane protease YdiL (CAAX protease family)